MIRERGHAREGLGGSHVACRNFKMSRVDVLSKVHVAVGNWATYISPCRNFNEMTISSLLDFSPTSRWSRWRPSLLSETSDLPSLFWALFWLFFLRNLFISVLDLPLYSLSFSFSFSCFLPMTKEYHRSKDEKDWCNISQIDTRRTAQAEMISNT